MRFFMSMEGIMQRHMAPARRRVQPDSGSGCMMYISYIMHRTQIYLDDHQDRRLTERSRQVGRTKSAIIREAIDAYLAPPSGEGGAVARLRAAVREACGAAPHLPTGAAYVEELRALEAERQRLHD